MASEVRYTTTSDGVRIAYAVTGQGPPLVLLPNIFSSFSLMHELPWYDDFLQRVSEGRMLIRYDLRGTGLSQREVAGVRYDALAKDVEALLDALRLERASLLAGGPVGPVAVWFAASRPERVAALVVFGTLVRLRDMSSREVFAAMANMARGNWEVAARTLAGMSLQRPPEEATKLASVYQRSISGDMAARYLGDNLDADISASLPEITARTLIIHSQADSLYPFAGGQEMAAQIPNARLLPLEGNLGLTTLGDKTEMATDAINAFLDEYPETRRLTGSPNETSQQVGQRSGTAIILFTDIVDSTALTERLGDTAFRDKARALDAAMRAAIRDNGGTPVEGKTLGDGVLAVFTSAKQAIACAQACHEAAGAAGLSLHAGIHAGDVIREADNVYGGAVNIAARVAAASAAGETLVSGTVRDLARTSAGVTFEDRGEQALKGIDDAVRLFAVRQA
jgi:class 3 adenylate cyclase